MIEVVYYREHNRLTVRGHAQSNEPGRDLICSACSILALTMAANVGHMDASGCVTDAVTILEEGNAEISCKPKARFKASVKQTFVSICVGFEILASKYPDYISYAVRGW